MLREMRYKPEKKSTYEIRIKVYDDYKEELSLDFIPKIIQKGANKGVALLVGGTIISIIVLTDLPESEAANVSMGYLYEGTETQQIEYVKRTKKSLNTVAPSYFDVDANGKLVTKSISQKLIQEMHHDKIRVTPFVSNHFSRPGGIAFLKDYEANAKELAKQVTKYDLDGLNIDIENVTHSERELYTKFIKVLRENLPKGKILSVAVSANPNSWTQGWHGSYDYEALAKHCDYLLIMAYDQHYQGSEAGPVAAIDWVEKSIQYALKHISKDKIVLGIPFFGRIWSDDGTFKGIGMDLNFANSLIETYKGSIHYNKTFQSPQGTFTIKEGTPVKTLHGKELKPGKYTIWFENDASIKEKLALVNQYDLEGAGSWALGKETTSIWNHYAQWLDLKDNAAVKNAAKPESTPKTNSTSKTNSSAKKITGSVTASILNVREKASTRSKVISKLKKGQKVTIVTKGKSWHTIMLSNGKKGYVSQKYIKL